MPVAALTAYQVLYDVVALQPGQRILIHGGAGNVGSLAIQFARKIGVEVITTASARNAEYVRQLGAAQVIDYQTQAFDELVSGVDVVFDTVGGEVQSRSWRMLRPGGQLASTVRPPSPHHPKIPPSTGSVIDDWLVEPTSWPGSTLDGICEMLFPGSGPQSVYGTDWSLTWPQYSPTAKS